MSFTQKVFLGAQCRVGVVGRRRPTQSDQHLNIADSGKGRLRVLQCIAMNAQSAKAEARFPQYRAKVAPQRLNGGVLHYQGALQRRTPSHTLPYSWNIASGRKAETTKLGVSTKLLIFRSTATLQIM